MPKTLKLAPFPPLAWQEFYWGGAVTIPWYRTESPVELFVRGDMDHFEEIRTSKSPPAPTGEQTAALTFLLKEGAALQKALLPQFQKHVPELDGQNWAALESFFELARVLIFHPAHEGVAYVGLISNCLQWEFGYEHGVGIVMHKDRVVSFGMAEEAGDETLALKDLRRLNRARKKNA